MNSERLGLSDCKHFRTEYLGPALRADLIERTIPGKPNSRLQKYRLTTRGRSVLGCFEPCDLCRILWPPR